MDEKVESYEDVSLYTMEDQRREELLKRGSEAAINWTTSDGWPVGVTHLYIWQQGSFWITCTTKRKRVPALRKRPKSSVIVAFEDQQTITAKTLATVYEPGSEHEAWFFRALAELTLEIQPHTRPLGVDGFIKRLESENRVVIQLKPIKWITFDGRRVGAHAAGTWKPGDPWIEPDHARERD